MTDESTPIDLDDSVEPLRSFFAQTRGRPRFVTLLSPTCGPCRAGAEAVRDVVLGGPNRDSVPVAIVWIPMLDSDTPSALSRATEEFATAGATQFVDSERAAGRHLGSPLGADGEPAWDCYLRYGPEADWAGGPPAPTDWVHQLSEPSWPPDERYQCGDDLRTSLARMVPDGTGENTGENPEDAGSCR